MVKSQLDKTITALAGEFFVAGQLCLRGYVASLTLKNYPGVDIFCLNPRNGRQVAIQVKTKRGGDLYYVPESVSAADPAFVFVYIRPDTTVAYYVVPAADVARISAAERAAYLAAHPHVNPKQPRMVSVKALEREGFQDRWDLLGLE